MEPSDSSMPESVFLTFSGDEKISMFDNMNLDEVYQFKYFNRCYWTADVNKARSEYWYFPNQKSEVILISSSTKQSENLATFPCIKVYKISDINENDWDLLIEKISESNYYVNEVNIEISITELHESGFIVCNFQQYSVSIYFHHYRLPYHAKYWRKGTVLLMHSILPLTLRNQLMGFACTVRTHITEIKRPNDIDNSLNYSVNIAKALKDKCYLFISWWSNVVILIERLVNQCSSQQRTEFLNSIFQMIYDDYTAKHGEVLVDKFIMSNRSMQNEFVNPNEIDLILIRGCQDADYAAEILPNVYSVSELNEIFYEQIESSSCRNLVRYSFKHKDAHSSIRPKLYQGLIHKSYLLANVLTMVGCSIFVSHSVGILKIKDYSATHEAYLIVIGSKNDLISLSNDLLAAVNESRGLYAFVKSPRRLLKLSNGSNVSECLYISSCTDVRIVSLSTKKRTLETNMISFEYQTHSPADIDSHPVLVNGSKAFHLPEPMSEYISQGDNSPRGVRQLLFLTFDRELRLKFFYGLVIHVQSDNDQNLSVILRDIVYPDIITVYISKDKTFTIKEILIGSIIIIRDVTIHKSESSRRLYAKVNEVSKESNNIGIIGFMPSYDYLLKLGKASEKSRPRIRDIIMEVNSLSGSIYEDDPYLLPPPITCISTLALHQKMHYDRCSWTVIGRIESIKYLGVSLRCPSCYNFTSRYRPLTAQNLCQKCHNCQLYPLWEGKFSIDDGTSVCVLICEADATKDILQLIFSGNNEFQEFVDEVEEYVYKNEFARYDTYEVTRDISSINRFKEKNNVSVGSYEVETSEIETLDKTESPSTENALKEDTIEQPQASSLEHSECGLQTDHGHIGHAKYLLTRALESNQVFTSLFQFVVEIVHKKVSIISDCTKKRSIAIQEWNNDPSRRFVTSQTQRESLFTEGLYLECRFVKRLTNKSIEKVTYSYLEELQKCV